MKESEKLLKKYIEGEADSLQQAIVEKWYAELSVPDTSGFSDAQKQQQLELIKQNLPQAGSRKAKLWPRIAIAASIAMAVFGAGLFYFSKHSDRSVHAVAYANDIAAGTNAATLTLANGRKIVLTAALNGALASESGVRISKTGDGEITYEIIERSGVDNPGMNTLSTHRGETYKVKLPDGSLVWLNAESSLKYPASFAHLKSRKVVLDGEGYFEIEKDAAHPFIVKTKGQDVTVLGTHFNIKAYEEEAEVMTTLLEGSVRVDFQATAWSDKGKVAYQDEIMLSPGQQSLLKGESIGIAKADLKENIAWKDGDFIFTENGIERIMRDIARWYNIQVIYEGSIPTGTFSGNVSRSKNISQILQALESTKLVHFKVEGRKVYVRK